MIINRPAPQRPRAPGASGNSMKAFVIRSYGASDRLVLADVETPVPANNEVLVRVRATSVNPYDWHHMRGEPYIARLMGGLGLRRPKFTILGADMAGQVEAVGKDVTGFAPRRRGVRCAQGGRLRRVRVRPGSRPRAETAEPDVRAGGGRAPGGQHGPAGRARRRTSPAGTKRPRQRSVGRSRHLRRTDRASSRRGRHRRVQHAQHGPGPIDRCRRGH